MKYSLQLLSSIWQTRFPFGYQSWSPWSCLCLARLSSNIGLRCLPRKPLDLQWIFDTAPCIYPYWTRMPQTGSLLRDKTNPQAPCRARTSLPWSYTRKQRRIWIPTGRGVSTNSEHVGSEGLLVAHQRRDHQGNVMERDQPCSQGFSLSRSKETLPNPEKVETFGLSMVSNLAPPEKFSGANDVISMPCDARASLAVSTCFVNLALLWTVR